MKSPVLKKILSMLLLASGGLLLAADAAAPAGGYFNDFEKAEVGKMPDDFMALDGQFAVREIDGNKCLELAADPIGSYGALFGPEGLIAMDVRARIWGASSGKRVPELGIGVDDAGGYKLFVLPAQHKLELRKSEEAVASVPFDWADGKWTCLRLRVEPKDKTTWIIQAKAWNSGKDEPAGWMIKAEDAEAPTAGKASIWGNDFSEQPIRFDDLRVDPIGK